MYKRSQYSLFRKGDVIRTEPEPGWYGIAVVLDLNEPEETLCHICVTPLIFREPPALAEIDVSRLRPLKFAKYSVNDVFIGYETEISIYDVRNKAELSVIGSIDPSGIYEGELLWEPQWSPQECIFTLCGAVSTELGREAYITYCRDNNIEITGNFKYRYKK